MIEALRSYVGYLVEIVGRFLVWFEYPVTVRRFPLGKV